MRYNTVRVSAGLEMKGTSQRKKVTMESWSMYKLAEGKIIKVEWRGGMKKEMIKEGGQFPCFKDEEQKKKKKSRQNTASFHCPA